MASNGARKTDVLLLTATRVEAQAVLSIFEQEVGRPAQRYFIDDTDYFDLGVVGGARVMMAFSEMGAGGPGGAQLVVDDGIKQLAPTAVIMVGIAFGLDQKRQAIGDVLVAQQLLGYELQKIATDGSGNLGVLWRGDRPHASPRLLSLFRAGELNWREARVEFGLILSGDKLVDNLDFRKQLLTVAPEALGGEMEGTGLYASAYRRGIDWLLVKAICDWADGQKSQDKQRRQQLAAENAVRFTVHVLKQGGFARGTSSSSSPSATNPADPSTRSGQATLPYTYNLHSGWVLGVAWEPGGSHIASAGGDGTVRVWQAEKGETVVTYHGHTRLLNKVNIQATVYTLAWSPGGLRIASAGTGAKVLVWNATTGQTLTVYENHSGLLPSVYTLAWSPDGKRIASACSMTGLDKTVHIWNPDTGQTLTRLSAASSLTVNFAVFMLAWSPDGTRLAATCADKVLRVWNTETGQLATTYRFRSEWSSTIAWSPDSRYLAFVAAGHKVQIRDMFTGQNGVTYHGHTDGIRSISWSPDGKLMATASNDRTVHIWEASTGKHLYTYKGHSNWVTCAAWSPDGTRIASASNDKTVQVWSPGNAA